MLNKDQLLFDPSDLAGTDQVGSRILAGTDGDAIASQTIAASEWLQVASALFDGSGNAISSTGGALDVNIASGTLSVSVDGVYDGVSNVNPDNVGVIFHSRAGSIGDAEQIQRTTAGACGATIDPANINAQDVASYLYAYDGSDFARLTQTANGLNVDIGVAFIADDAADSGGSLKVGSRALDQASALGVVSAANDRADLVSDLYRRIFINESCNIGLASVNVAVEDTAVALPTTALAGRKKIIVQNLSLTTDVYLGGSGVATGTGLVLAKKSSASFDLGQGVGLFGITTGGTANLRVFEMA